MDYDPESVNNYLKTQRLSSLKNAIGAMRVMIPMLGLMCSVMLYGIGHSSFTLTLLICCLLIVIWLSSGSMDLEKNYSKQELQRLLYRCLAY